MNPSTAFGTVFADELIRCGVREAVLAPGSRSAPLALALFDRSSSGPRPGQALRLHVRVDERSAAFLALGLAKAGRRPVALVCTSGTAAAHFHAAVIEADEAGVPLIVLTADRPPELRGTGANQTIDQIKLYGGAVRWFCEAGVPETRPGMAGYWRSLACRAWALASGEAGGFPGPVHINVPLRDPLVPGTGPGEADWPESLAGRPGGAPWTSMAGVAELGDRAGLDWTERGVVVCGDGDYDPAPLLELAEAASWPVLAEPSSSARQGPNALAAYGYLLDAPGFAASHRPDVIVSAGRPGLSRGQIAFLRGAPGAAGPRHVVLAQGPGRWADPARSATQVAAEVRLSGPGPGRPSAWLADWKRADAAARRAADEVLDSAAELTEPRLARDLAAALPPGALLWAASSLPVRDLDQQMSPRDGLRILASRGTSGIDGLASSAIGAALAHQAAGGGPAAALLGDLALVHDAPGLMLGPAEPRPDLCLVVVNNDGGGIFSTLEQAAFPGPFERVFGTPHGTDIGLLARAAGIPHAILDRAAGLPDALRGTGLRIIEMRTERGAGADLRARLRRVATAAAAGAAAGCA
ncbi:MAG TPA: 2-succinyl-5-enolpyruvyl-6-hydroxy-3-cyclohexene-1-carboxylic-acid synthase [Streptosporangiaceae bacterium]|jgi:2-succinyl-5-enolpyruvyl-6-hydroxy-3-cyclohexene-1-carboxylate synthase|nr:2-succinyl-5-enolpyruvyl-6-hydroxy-3-cyclohexene-1-carboxylic-acid synthase [Streptosporangiaceae bacterium]